MSRLEQRRDRFANRLQSRGRLMRFAILTFTAGCSTSDVPRNPFESPGPRRYYADCSGAECVILPGQPGDGPVSDRQSVALGSAKGLIKNDGTGPCQRLLMYFNALPQLGGSLLYNSRMSDVASINYTTTWGGSPDWGATIRFGSRAFVSQRELASTIIHEAAHGYFGANDAPPSSGERSAYYWEEQCVA